MRSAPLAPPNAKLTDGVIGVRTRRAGDLEAIATASNDPATQRWLDDTPMDAAAIASSLRRVDEAWQSGEAAPLVIADALSDDVIGLVNLRFESDQVATIAYSVFPTHRGRGIAPRAVELVAGWAFADAGLLELRLEADEANTASIRVAEKCGFDLVDRRKADGPGGGLKLVYLRRAAREH